MKKMKKHAKTALCIALSMAMMFTSTGMTVFAEESTQAEETQQEPDTVQTEEDSSEQVVVEEELTEEPPIRDESEELVSEETDSDIEDSESTLTDNASESRDDEEEDVSNSGTENAPEESTETEETVSEVDLTEEDTETEETVSEIDSTEENTSVENAETEETVSEIDAAEEMTEEGKSVNENGLAFSDTDIAHGEYKEDGNDVTWVIDADGKLTVEGTGEFESVKYSYETRAPWYRYRSDIKTAEINVQGMTSAAGMFWDCYELTTVDLSNFDTSQVTDMTGMFCRCGLTTVDLSNFDTSKVTSMSEMFYRSDFTTLDLSGFDTSNVTDMSRMFGSCDELASLDISSFNTVKVTDMSRMFYGCRNLTSLDISSFDTGKVSGMSDMFLDCNNLTALNVGNFDTSNATDMSRMFYDCNNLRTLDVSSFDTSNVTNMSGMFAGCGSLNGLDVSSFDTSNVTNMSGMFVGCDSLIDLNLSSFDLSNCSDGFSVPYSTLSQIYTPRYLKKSVPLVQTNPWYPTDPEPSWYDNTGKEYTELPQDLSYSILLTKEAAQTLQGYIAAEKKKTAYNVGDEITVDDLTVFYCTTDGERELTDVDYTTNAAELDTSKEGTQTLIVTYKDLTVKLKIRIVKELFGEYKENGNDITWTINAEKKLTVKGTGDFAAADDDDSSYDRAPWYQYRNTIKSAEIAVQGMTNAAYMFYGCKNLKSINVTEFDTTHITNMHSMFSACNNLADLDLSGFDTKNVTDMSFMFYCCESLESLNVSSFDTGNVTDMYEMFYRCKSVTALNLNSFNTGNVTNMANMFAGCESLKSLDLSNFDTKNVTTMNNMFGSILDINVEPWLISGCDSLEILNVSGFDTGNVTNMEYMFSGCSALTSLDLSSFDTKNVTGMTGMFGYRHIDGCYYGCKSLTSLDLSSFDTKNVTGMGDMFGGCESLTSLNISSFDTKNVTDMWEMFAFCKNLKSLDLSSFNTENVKDMNAMFYKCGSLTSLDLSHFNTKNVKDMGSMFSYCSSLTSLDLRSFDTRAVAGSTYSYFKINIEGGMFEGCESLTNLDLSSFDTRNITNMEYMFYNCKNLTSLDLSNFDTKNVVNMCGMFSGCSNLTRLDINSFDTQNVMDMGSMFRDCNNLTSLDVSIFDTKKVTNMYGMFYGCSKLTSLDVSSFDTKNVMDMREMFWNCSKLTSLDLSSFDMGNIAGAEAMFGRYSTYGSSGACEALTQIYTPQNLTESEDNKVSLPTGSWYDTDGNTYTELPTNLSYSLLLAKDKKPATVTEHIEAVKTNTLYWAGDILDLSDLTVKYYTKSGIVKTLSNMEYTTNAFELDMTTAGKKTLIVTYSGGTKSLTAEITLTVEDKTLQITGIEIADITYHKTPISIGTPAVITANGINVTDKVALTYAYTGTQADGSAYVSDTPPANAGEYSLNVSIAQNENGFTGSASYSFQIVKAPLIITARDMGLKIGAPLPAAEDYKYDTAGLMEGDSLTTAPVITCPSADSAKEGDYEILISGADAGMNYEITYKNGILTVNETGETMPYYTVTFDLSGKGVSIINTGVKSGSLLEKPQDPHTAGYTFTGWYKNQNCTVLWDFARDTVQSDITLYAGWAINGIFGGNDVDDSPYEESERIDLKDVGAEIAKIKNKVYDQNAYEPVVKVTVKQGKKKVTLTEGADYRVLYQNNVNAGTGTVIVRGNGIYKGEITKTFTISQKSIKKLKVVTGSITGEGSSQTLPVYVYDGTKLLQLDKDYTLSDYKAVKANSAQVIVRAAESGNYTGSVVAKLTIYDAGTKIINPQNVTLKEETMAYTGKAVKPAVTVTVDGTALTNRDYKVQYQNNKNAGTAFVIVTGKGTYKGKVVLPFTIKAETVEKPDDFTIKEIKAKTYNGKLQKPSVSVTIQKNGKTKKLSKKDYTVVYKNNLHAGEATVTVTGKGNYAGLTATTKFTIAPQQIKKASLKGVQGSLVLTYSKRTLKEGTDYEKPEYGTVNKNKVPVTITGKGDFMGTMTKTVKVQ